MVAKEALVQLQSGPVFWIIITPAPIAGFLFVSSENIMMPSLVLFIISMVVGYILMVDVSFISRLISVKLAITPNSNSGRNMRIMLKVHQSFIY